MTGLLVLATAAIWSMPDARAVLARSREIAASISSSRRASRGGASQRVRRPSRDRAWFARRRYHGTHGTGYSG